ncbi:MAG: putative thiol oxidoreductase with 2 cytochrome c heme-binding site [Labilithrix sp.]|nr:putative thiol oxidoreductase with 2 cytochrome c heme-binding site [Labilithrix sp.]
MRTASWLLSLAVVAAACAALPACSADPETPEEPSPVPPEAVTKTPLAPPAGDPFDVPLTRASQAERDLFFAGDALFELPLRDADGLGPLYTRTSCGGCHASGVRGPGAVQKMVVVLADGVTASDDQSALPFGHTVHPLYTGGGKTAVLPPDGQGLNLKITTRVGPSILGRGYVEAILDSEIERVAAEQAQRTDGIHGRINHVVYASEPNPDTRFHAHRKGDVLIGRFGLKARIATLDDFTADALQGDMGITSPLRPTEVTNPDGLTDDLKQGIDVAIDSVNVRSMYVRLTEIPGRKSVTNGAALFAQVKCNTCHVPSMKTRSDYPIAALAGIAAPIYSDLLLHDMGTDLADGIQDGEAKSRDWRTPPLIGLRFVKTFLHDSRATTIEQAILMHRGEGSEANESASLFHALAPADEATLLEFVGSL